MCPSILSSNFTILIDKIPPQFNCLRQYFGVCDNIITFDPKFILTAGFWKTSLRYKTKTKNGFKKYQYFRKFCNNRIYKVQKLVKT